MVIHKKYAYETQRFFTFHIVMILSFSLAVWALPYIQSFISSQLGNYPWAQIPASYLLAYVLAMYLLPMLGFFIAESIQSRGY